MTKRLLIVSALMALSLACGNREPSFRPQSGSQERGPAPQAQQVQQPAAQAPAADQAPAAAGDNALLHPERFTEQAPANFSVEFTTTKGALVIDVHRAWAPLGADRFYNLVKSGFFSDVAFFRMVDGFVAQFGIHGNPQVASAWRNANIQDDPVVQSNTRGRIVFATAGPNTRTSQLFINYGDNARLDGMGFAPFAEVRAASLPIVDQLFKGYGEAPNQGLIQSQGNAYLRENFPQLDYIQSARVL